MISPADHGVNAFDELELVGEVRLAARTGPTSTALVPAPTRAPLSLHQALPGYLETPLISLPDLAAELGLNSLYLKDESERLGLPSFKVLGASWAVYRLLSGRLAEPPAEGASLEKLREAFATLAPLRLVAATDGNHGRALARVGRLFGIGSHILVPAGMAVARIEAIEGEGASVEVVDGSYDVAVETAAAMADDQNLVVADTAWEGYEEIPRWISEGYSTIFWEIDQALSRTQMPEPDLVVVQIGVGALARGVVAHYRRADLAAQPAILGVEPLDAACALESLVAGTSVYVPGPHRSVMVGLNAGLVSTVSLSALAGGLDLAMAIPDDASRHAVRTLADHEIVAGETGAAGIAGLLACPDVLRRGGGRPCRNALVLITEGVTDPISYAAALATPDREAQ